MLQGTRRVFSRRSFAAGNKYNGLHLQRVVPSVLFLRCQHAEVEEKKGFLDTPAAKKGFNRWFSVPPAVAIHLSIGSVYSWSIMNSPLVHHLGVVSPGGDDWTLPQVVPIFSAVVAIHGISAALFGKWQGRVGPRKSAFFGSLCFGGGMLLGGFGASIHSLPLLYLGYGVLGGLGLGLAYVPPVANLIQWFPDKRGMAPGITICGFGGGALLSAPLMDRFIHSNRVAPEFLGTQDTLSLITDDGVRKLDIGGGKLIEVVEANATDLLNWPGLSEGVYAVGTGNTGAAATLALLGAGYLGVMTLSSFSIRAPAPGWLPAGYSPKDGSSGMISTHNVHIDNVLKTPQFWMLWTSFTCIATAGMAGASVAKTMVSEIFGASLPAIVNSSFASTYVIMFSAFNLGGRLFWSTVSDKLGRKNTFHIFGAGSIPLYFGVPLCVAAVTSHPSVLPLAVFYGSTMLIFSLFGGTYATVVAYEADLFGPKYINAIHGRMLTASSVAGLGGPFVITFLRQSSELAAIRALVEKISPDRFLERFGAPVEKLDELVQGKSVTISKLMEIVPDGTADPTPFLYDSTMYSMAGLLTIAAVSNLLVKPVNSKYHMKEENDQPTIDVKATVEGEEEEEEEEEEGEDKASEELKESPDEELKEGPDEELKDNPDEELKDKPADR